jgi:hypothetical protein
MTPHPHAFPRSGFTQHLVARNDLAEKGFVKWIFEPGMLFGSTVMWWTDSGRRKHPHEGLDLRFYRGRQKHRIRGTPYLIHNF